MAVTIKTTAFKDAAAYCTVNTYQHFRRPCSLCFLPWRWWLHIPPKYW